MFSYQKTTMKSSSCSVCEILDVAWAELIMEASDETDAEWSCWENVSLDWCHLQISNRVFKNYWWEQPTAAGSDLRLGLFRCHTHESWFYLPSITTDPAPVTSLSQQLCFHLTIYTSKIFGLGLVGGGDSTPQINTMCVPACQLESVITFAC